MTAIIESSGLVRGHHHQQPSPPATAPLAKRVLAPVLPSSSSESVAALVVRDQTEGEEEEEELRKTSSLTALLTPLNLPPDLTPKSALEGRQSSSGQMGRDYQEKSLVLKLQTKLLESKESSVCSSVLSSLESVESNTSEGEKQELFITAGTHTRLLNKIIFLRDENKNIV